MIVEWLLGLASTITQWFWSLWPDWTAPAFLTDVSSQINGVLSNLAGVGAWVDWPYVLAVVAAVLIAWGLGFGVKVIRAVASYLPFIGGSG